MDQISRQKETVNNCWTKKIHKQAQKIHTKSIKKENEKRLILIKNTQAS